MKAIYDAVAAHILALGDVWAKPMKTQTSFYGKHIFAALSDGPRKGTVRLSLALRRPLDDPRIAVVAPIRPGRYTIHVDLRAIDEFDAVVQEWLAEAYATSGLV